jgi:hypothetical protein
VFRRTATVLAALALAGAASPRERPTADAPVDHAAEAAPAPVPPAVKPGEASWFALPVLFWLPETRLGYGATGGLHFHLRGAERASSVFVVGAYTLNQQGTADVSADVNLRRGTVLSTRLRAIHFPDAFYGLGPDSPVSARETYTRRALQAIFSAELPVVTRGLRAGFRVDLRGEETRDLQPGGALASGAVPGADGFRALGMGGSVTWDTRDRPLFPRRGSFAQAWFLQYPESLGDQPEFSIRNVEGRVFLPLGKERVLGAAAFIEEASGAVPFTLLPKLGSTRFLRGWREGRFRDRVAWAAQSELRVPIAGRFVGTAFGAFGDVAPGLGDLRLDSLKVAGGLGVRYRLTREGANIRVDGAISPAGPELYVLVLDAF